MKILHLTLHRHWFCEILAGRKTSEYRRKTSFFAARLEGRNYDIVRFRNGYNPKAPTMDVEYLGLTKEVWDGEECYAILLGKILSKEYCDRLNAKA